MKNLLGFFNNRNDDLFTFNSCVVFCRLVAQPIVWEMAENGAQIVLLLVCTTDSVEDGRLCRVPIFFDCVDRFTLEGKKRLNHSVTGPHQGFFLTDKKQQRFGKRAQNSFATYAQ